MLTVRVPARVQLVEDTRQRRILNPMHCLDQCVRSDAWIALAVSSTKASNPRAAASSLSSKRTTIATIPRGYRPPTGRLAGWPRIWRPSVCPKTTREVQQWRLGEAQGPVAAHPETSDAGERPWGLAELHRSEVRASASGINHYSRRVKLARRPDETWPCSVDDDASPGHAPISPVIRGSGRPGDG
jgi:hypothetical protein